MRLNKLNSFIGRDSNGVFIPCFISLLLFGGILANPSAVLSQACTPTSAKICVAGDDDSTVYVGGVSIGQVAHCNWDGTGFVRRHVLPFRRPFTGGTVCLAIETQNTAPLINYSSWDLDITCAGGNHSEITSDNGGGGLSLYYTPNGNPSPPPANDGSGNPWYSPNYSPGVNPFTFTPTAVNCAETQGKPIFNPVNGSQPGFPSQQLHRRQRGLQTSPGLCSGANARRFRLPQPTLGPTAFTITKALIGGPVYNVPGANDASVTYAITYCNTGSAVTNSRLPSRTIFRAAACNMLQAAFLLPANPNPSLPIAEGMDR